MMKSFNLGGEYRQRICFYSLINVYCRLKVGKLIVLNELIEKKIIVVIMHVL